MKKFPKILAVMLCAAVLVGCLAACSSGEPASQPQQPSSNSQDSQSQSQQQSSETTGPELPDEIYIAWSGPLTGNQAQYGETQKRAITLVTDKVNAEGGINGTAKIVVDYYDDKNTNTEALSCANKIVDADKYAACLGPYSTGCAMVMIPVLVKAEMPFFITTASHPDLTRQSDFVFRGITTQEQNQGYYSDFIYNTLGADKVALFYANIDTGVEGAELFTEQYEKLGGEIVYHETYVSGSTTDFTPMLSAIKESGAKCIDHWGSYNEMALILQQKAALDMDDIYVVGQSACAKQELIDIAGEAAEGFMVLSNFATDLDYAPMQEYKKEYEEAFGVALDNHACTTYDCINIVIDAISAVGTDGQDIVDWVKAQPSFDGVCGEFTFNEYGDPDKPNIPLICKDGQFVIHESYQQ